MSTITLDGVTLNPNMVWLERGQTLEVAQSMRYTLGGRPVFQVGTLLAGIPITLEATDDHGWITRAVWQQIVAKALIPGAQYVLQFDGVSYPVMFRAHDAPAVDMQPIVPRVTHEDSDYFIGQIKLVTV